jgi:type II secretory pathway pseudopilin PulG
MTRATPRSLRPHGRRGMAMLMAVMMISIIAAALAALTLSFSAQAKRTARQAQDAQLRQLLLAGQFAAQQSIGHTAGGDVALPADLRSEGTSVRYETIPGNKVDETQIRVVARLDGGRTMTQTLRFTRVADHWELRAAEL